MNKSKFVLIGTGIILASTAFYCSVKHFKKKKKIETGVKSEETTEVKSTEKEEKIKPIVSELNSKDLTLSDTIDRYVQMNNTKMFVIAQECEVRLKKMNMIEEYIQAKTIIELCTLISEKNRDITDRSIAQLKRLRGEINNRSGRMYLQLVPLPNEKSNKLEDMAFSIKFTNKDIKAGFDRLNAVKFKYRSNTLNKLYEAHYIELLYHLLIQYEDLLNVRSILPSRAISAPNVNLIGTIKPLKNYNLYLNWYHGKYGEEALSALLTENDDKYLVNWIGKDPLKNHLQTTVETNEVE